MHASRPRRTGPVSVLVFLAAVLPCAPATAQLPADAVPPGSLDAIRYRHVGPVGNRVSAVTGVPGDPDVFYIGAASGGIWKSTDGGHDWDPVFDEHGVQSIGALAVAPSDPRVVWAGTGEPFIRSNVSHGAGIFRSDDAGASWRLAGLEATGRIARVVIHPDDANTVFVAALGHLYGEQEERGVYRTTDGGATWERVLFVDPGTGASDLWMDPADPDHLIAGMWTMHIRTWGRWSGGPNDGLYRSRDGGTTWTRLVGNGLPSGTTGKIGLAGTPADPDRIYALIETNSNRDFEPLDQHEGVLWRSDDGGETWAMINADHTLVQRPHYYTRATVSPDDPDEVHFMATQHSRSVDGGLTSGRFGAGGDFHDMWIDPEDPDRMITGHDQGVSVSTTRGRSWHRPLLPIAQMYHVTVDTRIPYYLYGNRQDGPSTHGPSNTRSGGEIPIGAWRSVGGCESGWAVPDTVSNDVVWSGCYEGILDRHVLSTGHSRTVTVWPDNPEGWPAGELRYRFQWTFPIHVSPHDPATVYVGSQHVHRTRNGGQSWDVISPDLSTGRDSLLLKTGGLTPDDVSPTYAAVVFAIAESPLTPGEIWAGTNDGRLHLTRDGGGSWTDLTANLPGLPELATISSVEPSRHVAGKAYVAVDAHQLGDFRPHAWVTEDFGATWRSVTRGLPSGPLSFLHVLREDPKRPGLLYAGSENALHASLDDGVSWFPLQSNLPPAPVHWLTVQPHFDDLVVATYGRGFWIADDVTPLQQATPEVLASASHLFEPRAAYRFLSVEGPFSQPGDPAAGENPDYGASLSWWLGEPASDITLEIVDARGEVVANVPTRSAGTGLHRTTWNLRFTPSRTPTLRTRPLEHAHVELGPEGTRGAPDGGRVSILAPPGSYTVRLTVDGRVHEAPLEVRMDPASEGSIAGIGEQVAMLRDLRDEVNEVVDLIDRIEVLRADILARRDAVGAGELDDQLEALASRLIDLEMGLYDLRMSGGSAGQDALRWPRQLFARLTSLAGYVSGTDMGPTDQAREVHGIYQARLAAVRAALAEIEAGPRAEVDALLARAGLPVLGAGAR